MWGISHWIMEIFNPINIVLYFLINFPTRNPGLSIISSRCVLRATLEQEMPSLASYTQLHGPRQQTTLTPSIKRKYKHWPSSASRC